jgi:hypothetical protein
MTLTQLLKGLYWSTSSFCLNIRPGTRPVCSSHSCLWRYATAFTVPSAAYHRVSSSLTMRGPSCSTALVSRSRHATRSTSSPGPSPDLAKGKDSRSSWTVSISLFVVVCRRTADSEWFQWLVSILRSPLLILKPNSENLCQLGRLCVSRHRESAMGVPPQCGASRFNLSAWRQRKCGGDCSES